MELAHPYPKHRSHRAALTHEKYTVTKTEIFKATFAKEVLLMKRDAFVYIFKTTQVCLPLSRIALKHKHMKGFSSD